jgi:hypothetical protein
MGSIVSVKKVGIVWKINRTMNSVKTAVHTELRRYPEKRDASSPFTCARLDSGLLECFGQGIHQRRAPSSKVAVFAIFGAQFLRKKQSAPGDKSTARSAL